MMKKYLYVIASLLLFSGIAYAYYGGSSGVMTDTNCNQAQYFNIGVLCQDADDGKLYKGTGSAIEQIQAYDADLDTWAGISPSTDVQAFLGAANDTAARTELGLGTLATQNADNAAITGGTIDGATIGGTTPAPGSFTDITASGVANITAITPKYNSIGTPGELGFGVGVCPPEILPSGFTPMQGYNNPASENYGNYQFTDGSVMVWIPKFYYRMHAWGDITAITQANPAVVTQTAHGYSNGDIVFINNVAGMTQVNNLFFTVTKVDDDNYTIGVDSSAYGAYTSGGQATKGFGTAYEFNDTIITYGNNSIQIAGYEKYQTAAAANADGYALHRAFYDGGKEQKGFFIDKYKNSKVANGTGYTAASIKRGKPLSSSSAHNPFAGLTGGENYNYSAVDLAHRRDGSNGEVNASSIFHVKSVFQNSALAMLSLVHGQYSQTTANCAWYNATYNYPKGCNSDALKDTDDATVIYPSDGYANACRTGSGVSLAKTTHNGQASGVADLNGGMYEVEIGITSIATSPAIEAWSQANPSVITVTGHGLVNGDFIQIDAVTQADWVNAKNKMWAITKINDDTFSINFNSSAFGTAYNAGTDPGTITKGKFYATNTSIAMKSYTSGNTLATDHWGATGIAATMTEFAPPFKTENAYTMRMGSGTNQVLSESTSGAGWLLTGMGLPKAGTGVDATGTNLFGKDYFYQKIINDLCLFSSADWSSTTRAGVWNSTWNLNRASAGNNISFRLACYPE